MDSHNLSKTATRAVYAARRLTAPKCESIKRGGNLDSLYFVRFLSFLVMLSFFRPALGSSLPKHVELPEDLACFAKVASHFLGYDYHLTRLMGIVTIEGLIKLDTIFPPSFESRLSMMPSGNVMIQEVDGFPYYNHLAVSGSPERLPQITFSKATLPFKLMAEAALYTISARDFFTDASYRQVPFFNSRSSSLQPDAHSADTSIIELPLS